MIRSSVLALIIFFSAPVLSSTVPESLAKWQDWILDGHPPEIRCPYLSLPFLSSSTNQNLQHQCVWANQLHIDLIGIENGKSKIVFRQPVVVGAKSWVQVPGDANHWPLLVNADLKEFPVVSYATEGENGEAAPNANLPGIWLEKGSYELTGEILLSESIQSLKVPAYVGLIQLTIDGKQVDTINLDNNGELWLKNKENLMDAANKANDIELKVFRKLTDGIPIVLETRLELAVSGKAREITIGQLLPGDATPTQFDSLLPARIERDGMLRIQVRAGKWQVVLNSRFQTLLQGKADSFGFERKSDDWPEYEVWSFEPNTELRGVKVTGADSVDPSQLWVPDEWRHLATYRISASEKLHIEELYRGDANPPANALKLTKTIWLDFDGQGATIKDALQGTFARGWRLTNASDVILGRATVDGQPQVITEFPDGRTGVEIRHPDVSVEAISRIDHIKEFSATGWEHDIDSLSATLFLPPGWKLWHVVGPDSTTNTWLSQWDLWDIFICLLVVAVSVKLLGAAWSVVVVLLLALVYHDASAPIFSAIVLLFGLAFLKILPHNKFRRLIGVFCCAFGLLAVLSFLSFSVDAVRQAIYPQLEFMQEINRVGSNGGAYPSAPSMMSESESAADASAPMAKEEGLARQDYRMGGMMAEDLPGSSPLRSSARANQYDVTAENIQTGPGEPTWQWHQANLFWSGPVTADEKIEIYFSPPLMTRVLRVLHVLLMGALVARLLTVLWQTKVLDFSNKGPLMTSATAGIALLLATFFSLPTDVIADDFFPPKDLLDQYEQRLLKQPSCGLNCYSTNQVDITTQDSTTQDSNIKVRLKVTVVNEIGIPLPRFSNNWWPEYVNVDDKLTNKLFRDDTQWYLLLDEGVHQIEIGGKLDGEEFILDFGATAHNVRVNAPGWEISGITNDRLQKNSITLSRKLDTKKDNTLFPDPIASHIQVNRKLILDRDWIVETTVTRLAPAVGAIHMQVPLLDGEHVTTSGIEVDEDSTKNQNKNTVAVALAKNQYQMSWQSVIKTNAENSTVAHSLVHRGDSSIVEEWSIAASPRWHVETTGLTPLKTLEPDTLYRWRPWPGESVKITATKPKPVSGATTTIEQLKWQFNPGQRSSTAEVNLSIRSSIGHDYKLIPPTAAVLEKLEIDGIEHTLPSSEGEVLVPLHPGLQSVILKWRLDQGITSRIRTPALKLESPANNIDLELNLPHDRWPLFVGGPAMGPAMLYWGVLVVMLFVAVLLNYLIKRFALTIPLKLWHWMLLIIGMSTVNMVGSIFVFIWFFAIEARGRLTLPEKQSSFNLMQFGLMLLTLIAVLSLLTIIPQSLLSYPDMQVQGNGSSNYFYRWYQDHSTDELPSGWVISLPIAVYRGVMLLWSLWLVFALMRWAKWGWKQFCRGAAWKSKPASAKSNIENNGPT